MQTGRKILNLRCDRKITQQELARACDITPSALSKIEAGINSPRANVLWRIAKHLGVTVEYLLDTSIPYPYIGYSYRQNFLSSNQDPNAVVRMEVTREEQAFLEALRASTQIAKDAARLLPEVGDETLRLAHFLLNHSKIANPSSDFLHVFETLVTTGDLVAPAPKPARPAPKAARRSRAKGTAARKSTRASRRAGTARAGSKRGPGRPRKNRPSR